MVNGTIINYYFHCRRQCYLFYNRLNLEDNSENVKIGKAIHEDMEEKSKNTEVRIGNIGIDKITGEYVTEVKKSDADVEAAKWQLTYYLYVLKQKGVVRKGKLEFKEKNKVKNRIVIELDDMLENKLENIIKDIEEYCEGDIVPETLNKASCKKCAYFEYCYI